MPSHHFRHSLRRTRSHARANAEQFSGFSNLFSVGTSDFSFLCWFKTSTAQIQRIISSQAAAGGTPVWVWGLLANGGIQSDFNTSGGRHDTRTNTTGFDDGAWHAFAGSFDNSTGVVTIYIDGSSQAMTTNTGSEAAIAGDSNAPTDSWIGGLDGFTSVAFNGEMCGHILLLGTVITATDAANHAANPVSRLLRSPSYAPDLIAPGQEKSGNLIDYSGNGNDGTDNNTVTDATGPMYG